MLLFDIVVVAADFIVVDVIAVVIVVVNRIVQCIVECMASVKIGRRLKFPCLKSRKNNQKCQFCPETKSEEIAIFHLGSFVRVHPYCR